MGINNSISIESKKDVLIMADRLASLYYYMVRNIIDEVGEKRAEEMVKKIISEYGQDCGKKAKVNVETLGEESIVENYHLGKDLPSVGWEKENIEFSDKNSSGSKILFCPFANTWKNLNFEKWGRLYCYVDQSKYEGYNEELKCFHDKNILDGDDFCIIRVQKPEK